MKVTLGVRKKLKLITFNSPYDSKELKERYTNNCIVISWLWNSMEPIVNANIIFLNTNIDI